MTCTDFLWFFSEQRRVEGAGGVSVLKIDFFFYGELPEGMYPVYWGWFFAWHYIEGEIYDYGGDSRGTDIGNREKGGGG